MIQQYRRLGVRWLSSHESRDLVPQNTQGKGEEATVQLVRRRFSAVFDGKGKGKDSLSPELRRRLERLPAFLGDLERAGWVVGQATHLAALEVCAVTGWKAVAAVVHKDMMRICGDSEAARTLLLRAHAMGGDIDGARDIARSITLTCGVAVSLLKAVVRSKKLSPQSRHTFAKQIAAEAKSKGVSLGPKGYHLLLIASDGYDDVVDTLVAMKSDGEWARMTTYQAVLRVALERKDTVLAEMLFTSMMRRRMKPKVEAWTALLTVYKCAGDYPTATRTWRRMEQARVLPNSVTYGTLLSICVVGAKGENRKEAVSFAEALCERATREGKASEQMWTRMMEVYAVVGDAYKARRLFAGLPGTVPRGRHVREHYAKALEAEEVE
eukprot:Sspe_Gene.53613::Locus_29617_Transcript_2_2_Confidence_0.500_Length_1254::g.53613::m.53613